MRERDKENSLNLLDHEKQAGLHAELALDCDNPFLKLAGHKKTCEEIDFPKTYDHGNTYL